MVVVVVVTAMEAIAVDVLVADFHMGKAVYVRWPWQRQPGHDDASGSVGATNENDLLTAGLMVYGDAGEATERVNTFFSKRL